MTEWQAMILTILGVVFTVQVFSCFTAKDEVVFDPTTLPTIDAPVYEIMPGHYLIEGEICSQVRIIVKAPSPDAALNVFNEKTYLHNVTFNPWTPNAPDMEIISAHKGTTAFHYTSVTWPEDDEPTLWEDAPVRSRDEE